MARSYGVKAFRIVIAAANTPQLISATHIFTDSFRVAADKNNVGSIAVGDATVSVNKAAVTDGEPILKTEGLEIESKAEDPAFRPEIDLGAVYVVGSNKDDVAYVTYLTKVV